MKIDHTRHGMKHGGPESGRQDDSEKQTGDPMPEGGDTKPTQEPKADEGAAM